MGLLCLAMNYLASFHRDVFCSVSVVTCLFSLVFMTSRFHSPFFLTFAYSNNISQFPFLSQSNLNPILTEIGHIMFSSRQLVEEHAGDNCFPSSASLSVLPLSLQNVLLSFMC